MNWSAIAAFTAAGLSALNILISYRLAHRGQLEQWRREQERPIVARLLTLSAEAYTAWTDLAIMKQNSAQGVVSPRSLIRIRSGSATTPL